MLLTALGFSPDDDALYQRLRPQSGRALGRVAASMLRTPEELVDELAPLLEAGVVRIEGDDILVAAPTEVLRSGVEREAAGVAAARHRLEGIARAVDLLGDETAPPPEAGSQIEGELVTGGDVFAAVRSLVLHGTGDLLWLRPDQWRGPREHRMAALVAEAVAQGRRSRAIYPMRAVQEAPEALAARAAAGEEVRVLPELPSRLLVIGDSHAVLPEPLGLADLPLAVVRQRSVVQATTRWFELLWERAEVAPLAAAQPPVDLRRFLLAELAAGARDEQIARKLGISLRTVRRRVAGLLAELGADTRFQAGIEAARRGWV